MKKPDREFIDQVKASGGCDLKNCYQCATCSAVCKLSPEDKPFPRKEMLLAQWGQKDKLMADTDVWLCHQCNDCSVNCPRGAKPGEALAAIRNYAFGFYAVPRFMGRLLAKPSGLPVLLLIPVILIGALMLMNTGGDFSVLLQNHVEYKSFIPHIYIEGLFIGGNILIFAFAAAGLFSFWRGMKSTWNVQSRMGFIPAVIVTLGEIAFHNRFSRCDASRFRKTAHFLVLFGFLGAMATAGLAVIAMTIFNYGPPVEMSHPIKWLGNASGIAMLVGIIIIIVQHSTNSENSGKAGYSQWLFIWMFLVVAVTGMSLQALRLLDLPLLAYSTYFFHLVAVFFLLWYAPYSHFGHMFYRTLAMVFAQSVGRKPQQLSTAA